MNLSSHKILLVVLGLTVVSVAVVLAVNGFTFYNLPLEERYFHAQYQLLKPSGVLGHGLGIIGALLILTGLFTYMARKRIRAFARIGLLKHWLEFHIFMCSLGPVLIVFHTTFKFGGLVGVCFWSMAIVVLSGVIGRYVYLQIPRTLEGRDLTLREVQESIEELENQLTDQYNIREALTPESLTRIKSELKKQGISAEKYKEATSLMRKEMSLTRRIKRLELMHKLFKYWHVAHLPFALIMLITLIVHVTVVILLGYTWVF